MQGPTQAQALRRMPSNNQGCCCLGSVLARSGSGAPAACDARLARASWRPGSALCTLTQPLPRHDGPPLQVVHHQQHLVAGLVINNLHGHRAGGAGGGGGSLDVSAGQRERAPMVAQ